MNTETIESYRRLARRLDSLPNGFPPSPDQSDLHLLACLFTPEQADLAASLRLTLETPAQIANRLGADPEEMRLQLKEMVRKGLIAAGQVDGGFGYGLLPFVVGIYEMQVGRLEAETAEVFERYYQQAFGQVLSIQPPVHRVIPVNESIQTGLEVRPYESAAAIVGGCQAWGVVDCICRQQQALIGKSCDHPLDVCMVLSTVPGAFDKSKNIRPLTQEGAMATLRRAAEAGLVHSVSNNQEGLWYICNCCTCSCGILRGMAELGLANVITHSAYINTVSEDLCIACGDCVETCQFDALELEQTLKIHALRCTGCGVCALSCPEEALSLVLRPDAEQPVVPVTPMDWMRARAEVRGQNIADVI